MFSNSPEHHSEYLNSELADTNLGHRLVDILLPSGGAGNVMHTFFASPPDPALASVLVYLKVF